MSRKLEIITPEQVAIRYELAGFGTRAGAALIDVTILYFLIHPLIIGLGALLIWLKILPAWEDWERWYQLQASIVIGLGILASFLVTWGYYLLFETLWNGETPGKRWLKLRVIKDDGHPVDFRAVLIRNLMRVVDSFPIPMLTYNVALVVMLFSRQYRRLGDFAAGTVVVRHGQDREEKRADFGHAVTFRLLDATALARLSSLTRDDIGMAQRFIARRAALPFALRLEFARRLAQPLINKLGYQPPALGMDYERWLEELDLAYRTRALGMATPVSTSPSPVREEPRSVTSSAPAAGNDLRTRKW